MALAVLLKLSAPLISDFKAMLPPGFSLRKPPAPPSIEKEIERLLEGVCPPAGCHREGNRT